MNRTMRRLILLTFFVVSARASVMPWFTAACFATAVAVNTFVSDTGSILSANTLSFTGLTSAAFLLNDRVKSSPGAWFRSLFGAFGLGFAVGRLVNSAVLYLKEHGIYGIWSREAAAAHNADVNAGAAVAGAQPRVHRAGQH